MPLSDHADYDELFEAVARVEPRVVYCTHGPESFVDRLRDAGYDARPLGRPTRNGCFEVLARENPPAVQRRQLYQRRPLAGWVTSRCGRGWLGSNWNVRPTVWLARTSDAARVDCPTFSSWPFCWR